jgi:hypothetical protein
LAAVADEITSTWRQGWSELYNGWRILRKVHSLENGVISTGC